MTGDCGDGGRPLRESFGETVQDAVPPPFDIGILLLIVLDQQGRVVGKGALPHLVGPGRDRLTGREEEKADQDNRKPGDCRAAHAP